MDLIKPPLPKVKHSIDEFPIKQEIIAEMMRIMKANNGIGLATTQIGLNEPFFVGQVGKEPFVVCEPFLEVLNPRLEYGVEGCLSLPGLQVNVPRYTTIRLYGRNENGVELNWVCKGLLARVIQHECDHLQGRLISHYSDGGDNAFSRLGIV